MPNHRFLPRANYWFSCAAGLAACSATTATHAAIAPITESLIERAAIFPEYSCRYDGVLGTSMEMIVQAPSPEIARQCEETVLAEIDRLSGILSTYDAGSEISRVMKGSEVESSELDELLHLYDTWNNRTAGVIHANLGEVKRLWHVAERDNQMPDVAALRGAFALPRSYNVDALGKAYIIDRAVERARQILPVGLLNIGGDIRAWGDKTWTIGVADPMNPADNIEPIALFPLRERAIASSGGYARYLTIGGRRYSHLIDPRSLQPVDDCHRSSTVVAPDCVTGNALSTALCIGDIASVREMLETHASGHLTYAAGRFQSGGVLASVAVPSAEDLAPDSGREAIQLADAKWMKDFKVEIPLVLKVPDKMVKRPYVVIWIENENGKPVRNITLWGRQDRYLPRLSTWWKLINANLKGAQSIAAATRPAGKYLLRWDGRNDAGVQQPQGTYTVHVEICREHGTHAESTTTIKCGTGPESATMEATTESEESKIEYKKGR